VFSGESLIKSSIVVSIQEDFSSLFFTAIIFSFVFENAER
jgi:hypothetical protein